MIQSPLTQLLQDALAVLRVVDISARVFVEDDASPLLREPAPWGSFGSPPFLRRITPGLLAEMIVASPKEGAGVMPAGWRAGEPAAHLLKGTRQRMRA